MVCVEDSSSASSCSYCKTVVLEGAFPGALVSLRYDEEDVCFERELRAGDVVSGYGTYSAPSEDSSDYFWTNALVASVYVEKAQMRELPVALRLPFRLRNAAIDLMGSCESLQYEYGALSGDGATALLQALLCGYKRSLVQSELYESFQIAGLAHLVAVSGAHLSIMAGVVTSVLNALRVRRRYSVGVQAVVMLLFVSFAGVPVSAVRSYIMAVCCLMAWYSKRRPSALNALGICLIAMIALHPSTALSLSFALSAGSTAGILIFAPLFKEVGMTWHPHLPNVVHESVSLSLSAALCTQLLSSAIFCQLSLISPLSNCLVAPLFPVICIVGMALLLPSVLIPSISGATLLVANLFSSAFAGMVELLGSVPYASVPVDLGVGQAIAMTICVTVLTYVAWLVPSRRSALRVAAPLALVGVSFILIFGVNRSDEIIVLDVGQGDSIVVRSNGCTVMVDTGTEDDMLLKAMARNKVHGIDALLITHPDDDHCGSYQALCAVERPEEVLVSACLLSCDESSCVGLVDEISEMEGEGVIQGLTPGDVLVCGSFRLSVIWPDEYSDNGGNADSLCVVCDYDSDGDGIGEWRTLLCGDAEADTLRTMISQKRVSDVDVLKVGHHGSKASIDETVVAVLSPEISLISVGEDNNYGHPSGQAVSLLEKAGSTLYRTDLQGDLTCTFYGDRIEVRTLR